MKRLSATILTNRFPVSGLVPGNVIIDNVIITWCMCLKNRRAKWRKREKALGNDVPSVFGTGGSNEMINSSFVGSSMFYNNSSTSAADFYHQHLHDSLWSTANGSMHPFLLLAGNSIAAAAAFGAATNTTWPSVPLQKVPTSIHTSSIGARNVRVRTRSSPRRRPVGFGFMRSSSSWVLVRDLSSVVACSPASRRRRTR